MQKSNHRESRGRAVYRALRILFGRLFGRIMQFSCEPNDIRSDVFLFLSNHNSDFDPFYEVIGTKRYMRFVASENLLHGFFGGIIRFLVDPIPRKKGASADQTTALIEESLMRGVSVAMHPEGKRSWDGETGFIPPRTARILKNVSCALVTFRVEGGYLKSPRWAVRGRKGPVRGHVIREYSSEVLSGMTEEEIYDIIRRDLYQNAYAYQAEQMTPYRARRPAEGLENALYLCPRCEALSSLESRNDTLRCTNCGYAVRYTAYGYFEGEAPVFSDVLSWSRYQKSYLIEHAARLSTQTASPLFVDHGVSLLSFQGGRKRVLSRHADAAFFGNRIEVTGPESVWAFPLADISAMGDFRISRVFFTCRGEYFELYRKHRMSGSKYFALWRTLTFRKYV